MPLDKDFYRGKRVLVTGHTGFKGSWLCKTLVMLGAEVTGFALTPPTDPSLFALADIQKDVHSILGDVRNLAEMQQAFEMARPELVFHLAAQPLVRESYVNPVFTYETNVMGTVHLLECVRNIPTVKSVLNVTTDKVYYNREWVWGYRENETLDGFDPYSNSKSCSELVTSTYRRSFFSDGTVAISTARAGNVIGGGDFAKDRILPDCIRAASEGREIVVRNPFSVRPYQHVLEPVYAYLLIAASQYETPALAGAYNVGPEEGDCCETGTLANLFVKHWGEGARWISQCKRENAPHEANFLKLDCSKLKNTLNWKPKWNVDKAVKETVHWSKCYLHGEDVRACMEAQIREFLCKSQTEKEE